MKSYGTSKNSGMQAPLLDKDEGICFRCMDCKTRYECIIQVLQDLNPSDAKNQGYDRDSYLLRMQCAFRQFEAWACSISTFQDDVLSKIFEFCVKDSTELKRTVMTSLGTLKEFLYEVWLIFTQKKANESWPLEELSDSDEEGTTMESGETLELQKLSRAMENTNTGLFRTSRIIRIISNADDYLIAAAIYQLDGVDDWLITRLGKALTRRRQYLKYVETYPKELMNCDNIAVGEDKPNVSSHTLRAFENIPIQYGVPFQCPHFRMEQVAKDHAAWKEHVFRDLKLYIYTFKEYDLKMFGSLDRWFSHKLCNHRREWVCEMCQHTPFPSSSAYEDHLRSEHQINEKGSQLRALVLQGEEPVNDVSATACPFCDNWEKSIAEATKDKYMRLMTFKEHLGKHMEQLALLSLP
ncbi:hypothetical protein BHYA_0320g00100 [Botrytis hyacinthi]|uniref:Oxidoreductase acuF-like C2H2 type zinc-finger domain-containing protein n=1 Tax=Botrytis hyacinthi TaxID=278943 RepID=A0A4Z1G693_9HELO|nr:hypothetical protein BHYA_0320g00100 [Botrytis hyacinthi]